MITIIAKCEICDEEFEIEVNDRDYENWENGALVQNAFPYISPDMRELLISGTCPQCWDKMFGIGDD